MYNFIFLQCYGSSQFKCIGSYGKKSDPSVECMLAQTIQKLFPKYSCTELTLTLHIFNLLFALLYRSPATGLYYSLAQYNLPYPEAIFDLRYFSQNPKPFLSLAQELYPGGKYKPNLGHYFVRLLDEKKKLLRMYTQNIDGLERCESSALKTAVNIFSSQWSNTEFSYGVRWGKGWLQPGLGLVYILE